MTDNVTKQRQSNMELLRIVAMFLVLVVHADFFSLGAPTVSETQTFMLSSGTRFFFEALSIVCVNVFVLISGWFAIRPNVKSLCNFLFQCIFFLGGVYLLLLLTGHASLSVDGVLKCFFMTKWNWFIKAYLGLYILSPVLNAFVEHADRRRLGIVVLSFYLFQTLYSWCTGAAVFFEGGYSTLSFIGLYLLARYARLYMPDQCGGWKYAYLGIYSAITVIITITAFVANYLGYSAISERMFFYTNPLVILSALSLLLFFSKISFRSRLVNWIGASSFAVFLLHTNPNLCLSYFKPWVLRIYESTSGIACLGAIFLFLTAIFILAIAIDQVRIFIWRRLLKIVADE